MQLWQLYDPNQTPQDFPSFHLTRLAVEQTKLHIAHTPQKDALSKSQSSVDQSLDRTYLPFFDGFILVVILLRTI